MLGSLAAGVFGGDLQRIHVEGARAVAEAARAEQASGQARPNAALAARLVAYHLQAYRNKRCLLAYHRQRLDWLRARVWDKAGSLSLVLDEGPEGMRASLRTLLDPTEFEWLRSYAALVALYKDAFLDVLDVTWPITQGISPAHAREALGSDFRAPASSVAPNAIRPPEDVMLSVLVTRNVSHVETERGTMHLRAGERLHVRRDEVEGLPHVIGELAEIVEKYGDDRRSQIVPFDGDMNMEDLIPEEDVVVTITRTGYAKRTKTDLYRAQKRGGRGVRG